MSVSCVWESVRLLIALLVLAKAFWASLRERLNTATPISPPRTRAPPASQTKGAAGPAKKPATMTPIPAIVVRCT